MTWSGLIDSARRSPSPPPEAGYSKGAQFVAVNSNNPHLSPFDTHAEMVARAGEGGCRSHTSRMRTERWPERSGRSRRPTPSSSTETRRLRYRGRIDDARIAESVTKRDLDAAIGALLDGRPPLIETTDPFGCSIIW
jgi:hypothetical protein